MALNREQSRIAPRMAVAFALTLAGFALPIVCRSFPAMPSSTEARLALWGAASALAVFWVVIAVARLARHRFFTTEDIDGGASSTSTPRAQMLQAMLQNTLEQAFLAVVAYGAWIALADANFGALPALFVLYFTAGRILFFAGYARGAAARALGFALTFYPSASLIVGANVIALVGLTEALGVTK